MVYDNDNGDDMAYNLLVNLQGICNQLRLYLTVVDEDDKDKKSQQIDLGKVKGRPYKREDATQAGTRYESTIRLPTNLKPGVALLNKYAEDDKSEESPPFVATMVLRCNETGKTVEYTAYSYIDITQGDRIIFPASLAYPGFQKTTPAGLQYYRNLELKNLRGTREDKSKMRQGAERIYDYDLYNDLAGDWKTDNTLDRPVLGGSKARPYPRRIRTGRPMDGKNETGTSSDANDLPWLPQDEHFNNEKWHAFKESVINTAGNAGHSVLGTPRGLSFALELVPFIEKMKENNIDPNEPRTIFEDLGVVDALYQGLHDDKPDKDHPLNNLLPVTRLKTVQVLDILQKRFRSFDVGLKKALGLNVPAEDVDDVINKKRKGEALDASGKKIKHHFWQSTQKDVSPRDVKARDAKATDDYKAGETEDLAQTVDDVVGLVHGLLEKWPCPDVREDKALQWRTDEEFGRMVLAGQNPFIIRALTEEDLAAFAVKEEDVKDFLEGRTLQTGIKDGRLWVLDHHSGYIDYVERVTSSTLDANVLYAGRCILYTRNNGKTVPVSIELETLDQPLRVYTPNLSAELWLLAKLVMASLDSGVHQLISHFLRTHACVEPYIIATRRELSPLNPVYKLLEPHFRYTMRINSNARKVLINAGGIVEKTFTPGPFCLELSSTVYKSWRFDEQGVPHDFEKRQIVEIGEDGKLRSRIPNYPYVDDALQIWDAIYTFAGDYLKLYYDDKVDGKKVTDDEEVMAWWKAVKEEGHPDTKEGWPSLDSLAALQDILASIMWVSSGHHAAVNFGQYVNGAYMPYMPSKINRKIPDAGSSEEKELKNRFEKNLLLTLTDPIATILVMLTTKILSSHASDEEYIDKDHHNYIRDKEGLTVHTKFVKALNAAEERMEARNKDPTKHKYSLLMPSYPEGTSSIDGKPGGRGIPYSISI